MRILNFNMFESVGVAEASLPYADPIMNIALSRFIEFYKNNDSEKKLSEIHTIGYSDIKPYIRNAKNYSEFPVVSIILNIEYRKMTMNEFISKYKFSIERDKNLGKDVKFLTGGYAVGFGPRSWKGYSKMTTPIKQITDHGLELQIGVSVDTSPKFDIDKDQKVIGDKLEESIWHELNHLYEYYKRVMSRKGGKSITSSGPRLSITSADVNKWGIPREIYYFWSYNFTYYLYTSEKHELNAQVQEAAFWVKKYGFETITETTAWRIANSMEKFNPEEFLNKLESEIRKYTKSDESEDLSNHPLKNRLKNMWVQEYKKSLIKFEEGSEFDIDKLEKMTCDEFVRYFKKRLNISGEYLKSKIIRLKSIDEEV